MSSLKVAVRVRPFNTREIDMDAQLIVEMEGKKTRLMKPRLQAIRDAGRESFHDFTFDYSYWSFDQDDKHFASQDQVYLDLGTDVVDCAFEGYNACVFAYGQTGSGKTFTMMGSEDNPGLIPRICKELFARMRVGQESGTGYKTHASYLEIYNERVKDLLGPQTSGHGLRVREHRTFGPYVENLSQHNVSDFEEIQECISRGNIQRTTASTNMNDTSSRSHAIFTITFVQAVFMNDMPSETVSKIHLVDLAGSERANATGATGQRLKEGAHINKSLVTLGSVISALAEQSSNISVKDATTPKRILYIPYRDSILTWLLKDSLGGNSKTIMIAALSPADCNYSETLSTLRYANRAKNIINKPTINEDANVKLIRELRDEINKLKSMLSGDVLSLQPSLKMLEDLQKKEAQEKVLTEEWTEKWKEAQSILQEERSLGLRKSGLGVVLDSEMPHLIGIHNDMTTGVTLYSLKEGETRIGTEYSDIPQDIELCGDSIRPEHCSIILNDGVCTLHPHRGAQCWLNAHLIEEPTNISQGDIILLGRTNIFRFNNPAEAAKLRKDLSRSQLDMSRLSLITSSRENLLTSSFHSEDDFLNSSMTASFRRPERQYYPTKPTSRDDPELQDENRKILDTIENALKQLTIERVQMHDQYKRKVRKLTDELKRLEKEEMDSLELLQCREQELLARKEMLYWEKHNEKVQIDILCRQIATFQTQLDSKKRDFSEYIAKELQELQDCGKLDEMGIKIDDNTPLTDALLLQTAESLDMFASQFIKETIKRNNEEMRRLDEIINEKEQVLKESTNRIAQVDENLLHIQSELEKIEQERSVAEIEAETMRLKKQNMKLNLNKQTDTDASMRSDTTVGTTCDTYHTAKSRLSCSDDATLIDTDPESMISPASDSSIATMSGGITEDRESASTNDDLSSATFTGDVTSTATNTNSNLSSPAPTSTNGSLGVNLTSSAAQMSDSGVYLEPIVRLNGNFRNSLVRNSDEETVSCSSSELGIRHSAAHPPMCVMHSLRHEIAKQKAIIMKNLENNVNKVELDEQIDVLQELQKRFVKMEQELLLQTANGMSNEHAQCCCAAEHDFDAALNYEQSTRSIRRRSSLSNTAALDVDTDRRLALGSNENPTILPNMTRSCPSIGTEYEEAEHFVTIPNFMIRGIGRQAHYEYEILIALPDGRLNILRRYSRFRELHLTMKHYYGAKIGSIPFPRRQLFASRSEAVARRRRRMLELYLRRLFVVCSKIPQCPIYAGEGGPGLTRASLGELSPFFRRDLFEYGNHGTG